MRASHSAAERGAQVLVIAVALLTWVGGALVPAAAAAQAAAPADVRTGSPVGEAARPGVVRGVVYDSSAGVPLAGAVVQLAPADRSTERVISVLADSSGRFQADGLAAGVWVVGFSHAALDAYGFDMPSGTVEVAAGDSVTVTLGLPGVRGLYRAVCGAPAAVGDPVAGLLGVVRDADTDVPAAGAQLSIAWSALEVANGVRLVPRRVTVATEADGTFSACGLPADVALAVRLESGPGADSTWTSGDLEVTVPPGTLARLTVTAGRAVLASGEAARDSAAGAGVAAAGPALAGEARLLGTVVDPQGAPVANARIAVLDAGREGVTDERGAFVLAGLPSGTWMVEVRALGYTPSRMPVGLSRTRPARVAVALSTPVYTLKGVAVMARTAVRTRLLDELHERTRRSGRLITEEELARRRPSRLTDALHMVPGLQVVPVFGNGVNGTAQQLRGRFRCVPSVFIDGQPIRGGADELDLWVHPAAVLAVEVYPSMNGLPGQYITGMGRPCAVVAVWTKR